MSLTVKNLSASIKEKEILKGINLTVNSGKLSVLVGPNGSGKSTLAKVLMGDSNFRINVSSNKKAEICLNNQEISRFSPEKRAQLGLFLSFQNPIAVVGVSVVSLLKLALAKNNKKNRQEKSFFNPALSVWDLHKLIFKEAKKLEIAPELLNRSLNLEFSGGEKKKIEMLQALILKPKYVILDEIDTGLDIDALETVVTGILELMKRGTGILLITHYQKIFKLIAPEKVYVLVNGRIIKSGDSKLIWEIEKHGYRKLYL